MNTKLLDFYKNIKGKKIAVLGIGVSNRPLIKMLCSHGASVIACDKNEVCDGADELLSLGVTLQLGEHYLKDLDGCDMIFKTPGMRFDLPELVNARESGSIITSEMEVFFDLCPCKIIAVTGSDGKSTTTTLISEILKKGGYAVHVGGNLGRPLLPDIESMAAEHVAVLELSSFQLHTMKASPHIAVVTNITPNHLDMHKSMEEYIEAKCNIFLYQNEDDLLILNSDNEITKSFISEGKGPVVTFGKSGDYKTDDSMNILKGDVAILTRGDILLRGDHNVENYMAAIAATWDMVTPDDITYVARNFMGLAHRLELVRELDGVKYYNDSIASSPTRTAACLNSFEEKPIIIAGGYDKKIPFDGLGADLVAKAKAVILVGATAEKIKAAIELAGGGIEVVIKENMKEAVQASRELASSGDCVVLSPACASFDLYKNFMIRGDLFKEIVNSL